MKKLPKGSMLHVVKTRGPHPNSTNNFDQFDLKGLSLANLRTIQTALRSFASPLANMVLDVIDPMVQANPCQTFNNERC